MERIITEELLGQYRTHIIEEEKSKDTIAKYMRDIRKLKDYANGREITKTLTIAFKEKLLNEDHYEISSINSILAAMNSFLEYTGWYDARVKAYKVQNEAFSPEEKNLTKEEFRRLVETARQLYKIKLVMILNTLCGTGIRVSELQYFTVESVIKGKVEIYNKGKARIILIPEDLQKLLRLYIIQMKITEGIIFRTSSGKPVDRSNLWREMKALCEKAGVDPNKVFPHNLRHLFARVFYEVEKDIVKLADVLGHSNIDTTRIYTKTSYEEHRKILDRMGLVC